MIKYPGILFTYIWVTSLLLSQACFIQNSHADELGRLFTTRAERNMLDELRNAKPEEPEEIIIEEITEEQKETKPDIGGITVQGIVYRRDGRNTAWIKDTDSQDGSSSNQPVQIDENDINTDSVNIKIPDTVEITLKVGETYDTSTDNVTDLTNKYSE